MTITIHRDLKQGTPEWLQARLGILTASEMSNVLSPAKLDFSKSSNALACKLAAEIISGMPSPHFETIAMQRGKMDEVHARKMYAEHYAPVEEVGFITRDFGDFKLGFSPDGLVGEDGFIECKSRDPKFQVETIIADEMPREYYLQVQTGLLVSGRKWCDFVSYSEGMHLYVKRILPDDGVQQKILEASSMFYKTMLITVYEYRLNVEEAKMPYIQPTIVLED